MTSVLPLSDLSSLPRTISSTSEGLLRSSTPFCHYHPLQAELPSESPLGPREAPSHSRQWTCSPPSLRPPSHQPPQELMDVSQEEVKSCSDLSADKWPELTLSWKLADAAKPTRESPPGDLPNPGFKPISLTSSASAGGYFTTWRRQWQPTPVFLLGEFHGQRSLAGYSPWAHKSWTRLTHTHTHTHTHRRYVGKTNSQRESGG